MKLDYAFLSDAARMLPDGTFDVIAGGYDSITANVFPATKASVAFIARVEFSPQECGKNYEFVWQITNKEGQPILPGFPGNFTPPPHPRHPDRPNWLHFCLSAEGVSFPAPGDYFFRLSISGKFIGEVSIEAVLEDKPT